MPEQNKTISIVIAVKNEERNIENCLLSLQKQDYPMADMEIIVVDYGSTDQTVELAKRHISQVFNLKSEVSLNGIVNFRGAQLNLGVNKTASRFIFFPDADMTFDIGLISEASGLLQEFDGLFAPEIVCGQGFLGKIRNFERSFYNTTSIDGVRFVKKSFYKTVGGFDEKNIMFGPDDWDFSKSLKQAGAKLAITKSRIFHHEECLTLRVYLAKKSKYGPSFGSYAAKWGRNDNDIKKQLGFSYRFFGVFLEQGKWKRLFRHPLLTVGMYCLRLAVSFFYLQQKFRESGLCFQLFKMENKIKIIAFLNAYSQGKSGGDIVFIETAKRLPLHCQITVVTSGLGKELCEQSGLSARYFLTSHEKQFAGAAWLYFKRTIAALKLKLERKDRTVFWGTSDFLPDILPAFFLKLRHRGARWLQIIHHLYANPFQRKGRNFFVNLIGFLTQRLSFFLIKRYANAVITVSALVKEQLLGLGFGPDKITVLHNGIDLVKLRGYAPAPQKYEAVFLGQHRVSKGIFDLLDIWRLVLKEAPQAVLALIGKGEQEIIRDLQKKIKDNSLEKNIRLLGYLPDEQAFPIIKASRVFVLPSYEEGFGIAPLEAQVLGLPVVAWDLPVFDEIFPRGMFKAPKGDIRKFAEIVVRLLNNFEFYGQASQLAAQNAGRYDWNQVAAKYLKLFEKLSDPSNL